MGLRDVKKSKKDSTKFILLLFLLVLLKASRVWTYKKGNSTQPPRGIFGEAGWSTPYCQYSILLESFLRRGKVVMPGREVASEKKEG